MSSNTAKILLLPLAALYWLGQMLWRLPFALGLRRVHSFEQICIVKIGNLSTGGTGKTPHVAYLLHQILKKRSKVSIISRGYGRKSQKLTRVTHNSTAQEVGDEPLLLFQQQPDALIYVSADRAQAVNQLLREHPDCSIALLDDGLQHWALKAHKNILLTTFDQPFFSDFMLPAGHLREPRSGAQRADLVIVSKCPPLFSPNQRLLLTQNCQKYAPNTPVLFSFYNYQLPHLLDQPAQTIPQQFLAQNPYLLLTAIAQTQYLSDFLSDFAPHYTHLAYPDHHDFTPKDCQFIIQTALNNQLPLLLTTQKDATRLQPYLHAFAQAQIPIYVLPIQVCFHDQDAQTLQHWLDQNLF